MWKDANMCMVVPLRFVGELTHAYCMLSSAKYEATEKNRR